MTARKLLDTRDTLAWHRAFAASPLIVTSFNVGFSIKPRGGAEVQLPPHAIGVEFQAQGDLPWWVVVGATRTRGRYSLTVFGSAVPERFSVQQGIEFLQRLYAAEGSIVDGVLLTPMTLRNHIEAKGRATQPVTVTHPSAPAQAAGMQLHVKLAPLVSVDQEIRHAFRQLVRRPLP